MPMDTSLKRQIEDVRLEFRKPRHQRTGDRLRALEEMVAPFQDETYQDQIAEAENHVERFGAILNLLARKGVYTLEDQKGGKKEA